MSRIKILPEAVINKIAAGEVVERPASVIKELVENALDAGAKTIKVSVKGGGLKSIRVEDDGCGMERDDLLLAFDRHSTSKLTTFSDLEEISTLGFRGEALPSIAGVSEMEVTTRPPGHLSAIRIVLRGGTIKDVGEVGAPEGTTVEVKRLFFNTPARRKFLKSPATEMGHVTAEVVSHALASPKVSFRLEKDGEALLEAPSAGGLAERLADLWGEETAKKMVPLKGRKEEVGLSGYISPPDRTETSRRGFYIFVNGRPVWDRMVFAAVREGYGPRLPHRRYPGGVIFLEMEGRGVDVNIHPTKREVRFVRPALVRGLVAGAVREALREARPIGSFYRPPPGDASSGVGESPEPYRAVQGEIDIFPGPPGGGEEESAPAASEFKIVGQVKESYVVVQFPDGIYIVDQHAAHERTLYEAFRKALEEGKAEVQPLLSPLPLDLGPRQAALLAERIPLLKRLGIEVEPFGGGSFIVTALPSLLTEPGREELVLEVIGDIGEWEKKAADPREEIIIRMACAAAVKARDRLAGIELERLIEELFECEDPTVCPHGRPTVLSLSWDDLEKRFGRK